MYSNVITVDLEIFLLIQITYLHVKEKKLRKHVCIVMGIHSSVGFKRKSQRNVNIHF